ncbi:hypothetical protein QF032_006374 [Streptomyces achromogenes]|nr:hypothetical protein [Streptomyces achromogenes]
MAGRERAISASAPGARTVASRPGFAWEWPPGHARQTAADGGGGVWSGPTGVPRRPVYMRISLIVSTALCTTRLMDGASELSWR